MLQTKRQSFAREFVVDRNATKAAERAGYSVRTAKQQGSRLLTYVDVQDEIAALERAQREVEAVDRGFVIAGLRELALNAKTESNRVRAYELLGKTMRMFVDVSETTHTLEVPELAGIPLSELLALREAMNSLPEPVEAEAKVLDD
jgi:phage terminase small subunit